ncbi:hypothetical protein P0Y35_00440 [Kiritimatiellaeota bacterium B1221]|nr:hypothetical protein [Kiritimatiellaeota bacterium B1221]
MNSAPTSMPISWKRKASAMRLRVNFGWFWTYFSPGMLVSLALCGVLVWLLRLQKVGTEPAWALGFGGLIVSALIARSQCQDKCMNWEKAFSRLDVGWGLNHRLVSALQGVGDWPMVPDAKIPLKVKSGFFLAPLLLGALFLSSAWYLPLPPERSTLDTTRMEPPDWKTLEALADELEEQDLVEEDATQALKREVEQLRQKPMEEWYDPSTLEATDRLRSRMHRDSERLMQAMNHTSMLLQLADTGRDQLTPGQQQAMQDYLQQMREQMGQGGLQVNENLLQQLREVDLTRLQQIDRAQLQQLEQALMENGEGMEQALVAAGLISMDGDSGMGGISRGGGPTDLSLRDFETSVEPVVPMALDPGSMENARMGDLLEVRDTVHGDERTDPGSIGGAVASEGGSGEVVWDQDVLPAEQKVLKAFFK